jgi:hypothetical protein
MSTSTEPSIDEMLTYLHSQDFLVHHLSQLTPATWSCNIKRRYRSKPTYEGHPDGHHAWQFYTGTGSTPYKAIIQALTHYRQQRPTERLTEL